MLRHPNPFSKGWLAIASLLAVALIVAACGSDAPTQTPIKETRKEPKSLTFMAGFKPQANLPFVAAYVAQKKGYFAEQALNVDIRHSAAGEHLQLLLAGDVQVTTADAELVLQRRSDPGVPIKAVALFGQKGQQAYIALQKSGINTPKDWEGKTFGYKVIQPPTYLALVKAAGVDRSKVREVRVGFDPRVLSEGQVDVLAVFKSNEPDTLARLGFPVRVFDPADYQVPALGLTYIVTDSTIAKDPDLVERFVRATMRGLQFAIDPANEEETLNIILEFAPNEDREHQRFMLRQELKDALGPVPDQGGLGAMTDAQWKALYDELIEVGALPKPLDYKTVYDDRFIKDIYTGNKLKWP